MTPPPAFPPVSGWDVGIVVLCLMRFLVPAEGVIEGTSLWIACGAFAFGALYFLNRWKQQVGWSWRAGRLDAGAAALILGHVLSGLLALAMVSDRRATLNSLWEWLSVGVMWLLLRDLLARSWGRELWLRCILVAAVGLSCLGMWQYFVWYPQLSGQLQEFADLNARVAGDSASLNDVERARYELLTREFGTTFLAQEASSRALLLERAQRSTEPIGFFALANTFAAVLLVGQLLGLGAGRDWIRSRRWQLLLWVAALISLGGCLLLTKSRTAWIALVVSGIFLAACLAIVSGWSRRRLLGWLAGGMLASLLAVGLTTAVGGLDKEVLLEAPKSLGYRLQYWQSTWELIQDHPLWGVGAGNFRQHYLAYKLPGASEEVRDPHNLFLDVWANGGLLALAGLLMLVGIFFRSGFSSRAEDVPASHLRKRDVWLSLAAAASIALGYSCLSNPTGDARIAVVGILWVGLSATLFTRQISLGPLSLNIGATAATLGLLVHLFASGGIGMPAILQVWLGLVVIAATPALVAADNRHATVQMPRNQSTVAPSESASPTGRRTVIGAAGCAAMMFGCIWTAWLPMLASSTLITDGTTQMLTRRDSRAAIIAFQQATQADPWGAEPWLMLAQAHHAQWLRNPADKSAFQAAVDSQQQAMRRDPVSPKHPLLLAEWWIERYRHDHRQEFAEEAVKWSEVAVRGYPGSSLTHAWHGLALYHAGRVDVQELQTAIAFDNANLAARHLDKLLPEALRVEVVLAIDFGILRSQIQAALNRGEEPQVHPRYIEIYGWDRLLDGLHRE